MQIPFRRIGVESQPFEYLQEELLFKGTLRRSSRYIKLDAILQGPLSVDCDVCGEHVVRQINEEIALLLSDGLVSQPDEAFDVVECYNGMVAIDDLYNSEVELIKSDYFHCSKCKID